MSKANKDVTVKEANEIAKENAKSKELAGQCMIKECMRLYRNETHSIQMIMAYCRQYEKMTSNKK